MKLLLAEDTKDLNRAISVMLNMQGYDVDSVYDGEEALEAIEKNGYDGIILDIMMPKKDGLSVLREIRSRNIVTPVMMLTAKAEVDDRVLGLDEGADDYLTKPFAMKELVARVKAMTRRNTDYSAKKLQYGNVTLVAESQEMAAENAVRLSSKEFELMQVMILNRDKSLSTQYLLDHVWEDSTDAGTDMVWLYVNYLRRKLRYINADAGIKGEKGGAFRLIISE